MSGVGATGYNSPDALPPMAGDTLYVEDCDGQVAAITKSVASEACRGFILTGDSADGGDDIACMHIHRLLPQHRQ